MKLLFDENISYRIKRLVIGQYPESLHQSDFSSLITDRQIWEKAKKEGFVIVTFDEDFFELQQLLSFPPKIIWLRCGNTSTRNLAKLLIGNFEKIEYHLNDDETGIVELY